MKRDYKWLESVMKKHGLDIHTVTCFIYEYMVREIEQMYENEEVDKEEEKLYDAVLDDIKAFVWGREE